MAPVHGSKTEILFNGFFVSTYFKSYTNSFNRDKAETSGFTSTTKSYVGGLQDATVALEGYFDGAADAADQLMSAWVNGGDDVISYFPYGTTPGLTSIGYSMLAQSSKYEIKTDVGSAAEISVEATASKDSSGTGVDRGFVAVKNQTVAATGNSTSYDNAVATTAGAALVVHGRTTGSSMTVTLEDSADNVSWATVAGASLAFSGGTVPDPNEDGKRIVVSGNVRRYTRVAWTGAGTISLAMISRK